MAQLKADREKGHCQDSGHHRPCVEGGRRPHAFGIPGGEVLELLEAFRKVGIRFVLTKQELGAGIMADAAIS